MFEYYEKFHNLNDYYYSFPGQEWRKKIDEYAKKFYTQLQLKEKKNNTDIDTSKGNKYLLNS
jgi:hypothetical protein